MTKKRFETRWAQAPDFAEFAEVLAIRTDQIMSVALKRGRAMVLYTPGDGDFVWVAHMKRDESGIFQLEKVPRSLGTIDEFFEGDAWDKS